MMHTLLFSLAVLLQEQNIDILRKRVQELTQQQPVAAPVEDNDVAEYFPAPLELPPPPVSITFTETISDVPSDEERLPRAVFFTAPWCVYCDQMKADIQDLTGDKTFPIEVVDTTRDEGWLKEHGLTHSMIFSLPTLIVLDKDGKVHDFNEGLGCKLTGRQSREQVLNYLKLPEHAVDVSPPAMTVQVTEVTATVPYGTSPLLVLAEHLGRSSGQEPSNGGFFDFTVDVPLDYVKVFHSALQTGTWSHESSGISASWQPDAAGTRSFTFADDTLTLLPAPQLTYKKLGFRLAVSLTFIKILPDGSKIVLGLKGAPDLTIIFTQQ